jgi:hypothetical protein
MLQYANYYASIGWSVIPVRGKQPTFKNWQNERANFNKISGWFSQPDMNIGIITGKASNIVVIDIDSEEGMNHIAQYITMPTAMVRTGGGGRHYYFRHPGVDVPNGVKVLPGVDVRGENGMVVAPPSVHPNGTPYVWEEGSVALDDLPALPARLLSLITGNTKKTVTEADWAANITEGNRDAELTRRAGKLFRAGMAAKEVLATLITWNDTHCDPPLSVSQIRKIVDSIDKRQTPEIVDESPDVKPEDYFKVYNFEDTLKKYGLQEVIWSIHGWLPEATCGLVVAPPASYKTWLLLDLAVSMATGKPFLAKYKVEHPGPVLLVQQEDPFPMLFSRIGVIMNMGEPIERGDEYILPKAPPAPQIYWHTDRLLNFDNKKSVEGLRKAISEIRPKLVIVDPLYSTISSKDYMAEGAQSMLALKQIRDDYGCSFMLAHHTVKRTDNDGREGLWGSQFLNAWLESGWQIRQSKTEEGTIRIKRHFKSSAIPSVLKLNFDINTWGFKAHTEEITGDENTTLDFVEETSKKANIGNNGDTMSKAFNKGKRRQE